MKRIIVVTLLVACLLSAGAAQAATDASIGVDVMGFKVYGRTAYTRAPGRPFTAVASGVTSPTVRLNGSEVEFTWKGGVDSLTGIEATNARVKSLTVNRYGGRAVLSITAPATAPYTISRVGLTFR